LSAVKWICFSAGFTESMTRRNLRHFLTPMPIVEHRDHGTIEAYRLCVMVPSGPIAEPSSACFAGERKQPKETT